MLRWLMVAAWAGLIFYMSTGTFGGAFTSWMLGEILALLQLHVNANTFELFHHLMRKAAHVIEYGIFSLLIYAALPGTNNFEWQPRAALWSALAAGLYSLTDEYHQRFVPGRGPSLADCGIDTLGAATAMVAVYLKHRLFHGISRSPEAASASAAET